MLPFSNAPPASPMASAHDPSFLQPVLVFCAGAVVAVPVFRRVGLGAVIGYLAAGLAIGPAGLGLVTDAATVRGVAELGIVLLLFVIGLELKLSRLLAMRRDIFGLGAAAAVGGTAALAAVAALPLGLSRAGPWWRASRSPCRRRRSRCRSSTSAARCRRPTGSAPSRCCCSRTWPSCPSSRSFRCSRRGRRQGAVRRRRRRGPWGWRRVRSRPSCSPGATCSTRSSGCSRPGARARC